jgi:hypothetical protein
MAALAVFLSGGSLAPPGLPPVPPAAHLAADTAANAITLATLTPHPKDAAAKHAEFLKLGLAVAAGQSPFPKPEPKR